MALVDWGSKMADVYGCVGGICHDDFSFSLVRFLCQRSEIVAIWMLKGNDKGKKVMIVKNS